MKMSLKWMKYVPWIRLNGRILENLFIYRSLQLCNVRSLIVLVFMYSCIGRRVFFFHPCSEPPNGTSEFEWTCSIYFPHPSFFPFSFSFFWYPMPAGNPGLIHPGYIELGNWKGTFMELFALSVQVERHIFTFFFTRDPRSFIVKLFYPVLLRSPLLCTALHPDPSFQKKKKGRETRSNSRLWKFTAFRFIHSFVKYLDSDEVCSKKCHN